MRYVLFDCDGVLVDTEPVSVAIVRQMLSELGWDLSHDEFVSRFTGRSTDVLLEAVTRHVGHAPPPAWNTERTARIRSAFAEGVRPVDGIVDALDRIALPTCVASSGSQQKMALTLRSAGLWDRFEGRTFSADEVEHGKPAPDLFLHAADVMGWEPADCVVVEDSAFGVQGALAAGMRVIAYAGGVTKAGQLERQGVVVIEDMRDLPDAIVSL